jgi:hypothetical protein
VSFLLRISLKSQSALLSLTDMTTVLSARQPDISYHPDFEGYQARTRQRLETEKLEKALPDGFPEKLESPLVWDATSFNGEEWVYKLNIQELQEIDRALHSFKGILYILL